jgi:hypothetical protein
MPGSLAAAQRSVAFPLNHLIELTFDQIMPWWRRGGAPHAIRDVGNDLAPDRALF